MANPREMFHAHLQASRSDPLVSQQIASFLPKKPTTLPKNKPTHLVYTGATAPSKCLPRLASHLGVGGVGGGDLVGDIDGLAVVLDS